MKISIITLFPKMISGFFEESIVKRAVEKKVVVIEIINLRDFAIDNYGTVDDRPYGGGAGMILRIEPLYKAIQSAISNFQFSISNQFLNFQFRKETAVKSQKFPDGVDGRELICLSLRRVDKPG